MNIKWCSREELYTEAIKTAIPSKIVLDVGAGIHPQQFFTPAIHIIVEPFLPYVTKLMETDASSHHQIYINSVWTDAMKLLPDKSVDTVFAVDVIEHFSKEDGIRFLAEAERVTRCQIILFTPLGMYPQSYNENDTDRWGMQGGTWQSHRSGWIPEDFIGEGWKFLICKDYHLVDQHEELLQEPFGAFWAIRTLETKSILPVEERLVVSELQDEILARYTYNRLGNAWFFKYRYRILVKYLKRIKRRLGAQKLKRIFFRMKT
jgi:hypothetical protein